MSMEDGAVPVGDDGAVLPGDGDLPPGNGSARWASRAGRCRGR